MKFKYGQVEAALVAALGIAPENLGAFRGRLQHLRKLGVPDLPRPGSGQTLEYDHRHALEMMLAVELENIGKAPRAAAMAASSILRIVGDEPADVFIAFDRSDAPGYGVLTGRDVFRRWLEESAPRAFAIIDLTACVRALDSALAKASQ